MMAMPTGPGVQGRKLYFFKLNEVEPRRFEAKLKSFVKTDEELLEIEKKVKTIVSAAGDYIESDLDNKTFIFSVQEENADTFMEAAMNEACIFRF